MDNFINDQIPKSLGDKKVKVLIATLYNADPVLLAANRLGPDKLILLLDTDKNEKQEEAFKLINESLGRVVNVSSYRTSVYDVAAVAEKVVEIIDGIPKTDNVFINITAGRKTIALGTLFAAYARNNRVKKIAYNPEEDKNSVVYLPKMSFKLNNSQRVILDLLVDEKNMNLSLVDLAKKAEMSRAMLYKTMDELKEMDFVDSEKGYKLTDAGKIARL